MESYNQLVGIPHLIGRNRWFPNASLSRVIVGHHLSKIDAKAQRWGKEHLWWLDAF